MSSTDNTTVARFLVNVTLVDITLSMVGMENKKQIDDYREMTTFVWKSIPPILMGK